MTDVPRTLLLDGSPPLYYLLLHGWVAVAGTGEAATRTLSLLFALAAVPVALGRPGPLRPARRVAGGRRHGVLPFLTRYAQETRMYSLVVLLSLVASAAFALAFVQGRREHLVTLAAALTLLLYTHLWGGFLAVGMAIAWLTLCRRGPIRGRDAALTALAVVLLYAPWSRASSSRPVTPALPGRSRRRHAAARRPRRPARRRRRAAARARRGRGPAQAHRRARDRAAHARRGRRRGGRRVGVVAGRADVDRALPRRPPGLAAARARGRAGPRRALDRGRAGGRGGRLGAVDAARGQEQRAGRRARRGRGPRPGDVVVSTEPELVPVVSRYLPGELAYAIRAACDGVRLATPSRACVPRPSTRTSSRSWPACRAAGGCCW